MRKVLTYSVLCLLLLCPALCRAQRADVVHVFNTDMSDPAKLVISNSNHVGTTPLTTYTCSGGAEFWLDFFNAEGKKEVCLNLAGLNHQVTTSAIDSLAGLEIQFYPSNATRTNIELRLSRDGVHWTDPIECDGMYSSNGYIRASFVPGRYFVRLTNTSSLVGKKTSIHKITYSFGACNCFLYIPEE